MSRPRILLMARTLRRDLPSYYVLKKIIEAKSGAAVVVCSQRSVFHYLRHWRPQALVYPCCGDTPQFAPYSPGVQLFCYSGEGGQCSSNYDERFFVSFPEYFGAMRRILLWGEGTRQYLLDDEAKAHQGRYREILESDKVRVVGHPRLDLARYFPGRAPRRSVGICTHFFTLNNFRGDSALNLSFGRADVVSALEFEVELLGMVTKIIDYLVAETDYAVSVRPYPLEAPQMYKVHRGGKACFYNTAYEGRVSVDDHLDFPGWAAGQDIVLSSVTTALGEACLLGVPMLFIDRLLVRTHGFAYYNSINELLGKVACAPKSFDELAHYIDNPASVPFDVAAMNAFMARFYSTHLPGAALERVADIVLADIQSAGPSGGFHVPAAAVAVRDWVNFGLERMRDPLCGNFHYLRGYHRIPGYYDRIADNILAHRETSPYPMR
ncbi:hypothetical protein [Solidesulfovibrio alcoholivorans]|uniref:hypothetical protein n=1 Tax=Solidesulfovibrio alcoholivorans TaxID=81406 RepID=UPI000496BF1C|nr:hypothetical protein [Solidesulfovibrio alcoholivorans]